jgi:ABC-type Fe3+/spermidine/putrescine transport system ATPase subunit
MIHFSVSMMIAGVRPNRNGEFILGGIDTIDMQWQQRRVELLPRWQACRSR